MGWVAASLCLMSDVWDGGMCWNLVFVAMVGMMILNVWKLFDE